MNSCTVHVGRQLFNFFLCSSCFYYFSFLDVVTQNSYFSLSYFKLLCFMLSSFYYTFFCTSSFCIQYWEFNKAMNSNKHPRGVQNCFSECPLAIVSWWLLEINQSPGDISHQSSGPDRWRPGDMGDARDDTTCWLQWILPLKHGHQTLGAS